MKKDFLINMISRLEKLRVITKQQTFQVPVNFNHLNILNPKNNQLMNSTTSRVTIPQELKNKTITLTKININQLKIESVSTFQGKTTNRPTNHRIISYFKITIHTILP